MKYIKPILFVIALSFYACSNDLPSEEVVFQSVTNSVIPELGLNDNYDLEMIGYLSFLPDSSTNFDAKFIVEINSEDSSFTRVVLMFSKTEKNWELVDWNLLDSNDNNN